jgi:hypothetical protein
MPISKKHVHPEKVVGKKREGIHPNMENELAMGGGHETDGGDGHGLVDPALRVDPVSSVYHWHDLFVLQAAGTPRGSYTSRIKSIDELLERDKIREEDGFPAKSAWGG